MVINATLCTRVARGLLYFLRASAMLKHVIDIGWTSVCLSVTRWYCIKTAEHIVMLSSHDSPFILVLCISRSSRCVHAAMRLTSSEFSFDQCNIYGDGPRGVGYPADELTHIQLAIAILLVCHAKNDTTSICMIILLCNDDMAPLTYTKYCVDMA